MSNIFQAQKKIHQICAESGLDLSKETPELSPLLHAINKKNVNLVELLIQNRVNINEKCGKYHSYPLTRAVINGDIRLTQLLLKEGANINVASKYLSTPLHEACKNKNVCIIQLLVENEANVKARTSSGMTPLHYVCRWYKDTKDIIQLLCNN